ncbi:MAG: hypothetical protein NXI21_09770 [Alphaproteobacteria bacterium]|nr:hypothetical protein [Alphaproteobacteria bacterium]
MRRLAVAAAVCAALLSAAALAPALAQTAPTPVGELQRGSMVTVQGTVERITDEDEFRLADETGSVRVYVGPNWVPAAVGEAVTVDGFVDDDFGPMEIYARSLTRADGTIVTFERRYD